MNTIQVKTSFDWDNDAQVEDFLASLGDQVKVDFIPREPLANVHTEMTISEIKEKGKKFGLSGFVMGKSPLSERG